MCGIVGYVEPAADHGLPPEVLESMCAAIRHRGPDSRGTHTDGEVGLGIRRLSIVDVATGDQPIANEDESVWVVHNGEIYNHVELRRDLEQRGHRFRTHHADTEVLVHAWEEWGEACVERLDGMFAFAVWDATQRTLLLIRDRIGIKPLYYWWQDDRLVFASEIKAILQHPAVEKEVDLQSLYDYLGWEFVPAPATMFRNIKKLGPGELITLHHGELAVRPWWNLHYTAREASEEEYAAEIRRGLKTSVKRRLMADVPLGVFLSGGLDSTAVLAMVAENTSEKIKTFTIGYTDPTFSEFDYARYAARHYGTEHREILIEPITPELIEHCAWHLDEPMTDLSTVPLHILCRAAREDVTVCLSGEGGDEVFVGYDRFVASKADRYYRILPQWLRHGAIRPIVESLRDREQKKGAINILKRFVQGSALPVEGGAMRWQYFSSAALDEALFRDEFKAAVNMDAFGPLLRALEDAEFTTDLDRELFTDLRFTMPESVLMKVDKMSMATSLEVRVPFLDHHLVEYVATIPESARFPGFDRRAIFKKAMHSVLPEKVLSRGKQGYSLPIKNWLREDLRDWMVSLLSESELMRRHFSQEHIDRLISEHMARTHNHNHTLWALINVALWHRAFIEQPAAQLAARSSH